jgi:hypothetical protein
MYAHPSLTLLSHSFSREDLFLVVFCLIDDWMKQRYHSANLPRQAGPAPTTCTDGELLTVAVVGELCGVSRERAWLRQVRASYHALFPRLPEESRYARRLQRLRHAFRAFRDQLLRWADADLDPHRIMDSYPLPLCACYRLRASNQPVEGSAFGYCASKRQFYFGLRPHVLATFSQYLVDLILAPGNCSDVKALALYLDECAAAAVSLVGQTWLVDFGYRSKKVEQQARLRHGLTLLVGQPAEWRRPIEGIISVLCHLFHLEDVLATTGIGLYRRFQAKITAFNLGRYFNHVLGREPLDLARYAV